ncbi:transglycosylase SLT domain-containing protein [Actinomadura rudentiformis]|uniref:Transglycosylase SLT domain-containing protein n=2 Tax=Actinomadura rudentiformis TaxID=359158 RepID=A0A6H9YR91_9ACTN|nr:transglycosylase SLT domain-containing protein [Actinomadura rudentiformis]
MAVPGEQAYDEPADPASTRVDAFPAAPLTVSPNGPHDPNGRDQDGRDQIGSDRSPRRATLPSGIGLKIVAVAAGVAVLVGGGAVAAFALTGDSGDGKPADKGTVSPAPSQLAADAPQVDPKALEAQRRKQALERASRAVRTKPSKAPALRPKGSPLPTKKPGDDGGDPPIGGDPVPAGKAQAIAKSMLPSYGFTGKGEFGCLVKLWNKESGWNTYARNPSSGAYGIAQALPGSKMASAGSDWRTNPRTQIKWGLGYIKSRYKTPCGAWGAFLSKGWY